MLTPVQVNHGIIIAFPQEVSNKDKPSFPILQRAVSRDHLKRVSGSTLKCSGILKTRSNYFPGHLKTPGYKL
jgi:hypothetical protein